MSLSSNSASRCFNGSVNRWGTRRGFCAMGVASSFIGTVICISSPFRIAFPMPVNLSWHLSRILSSSVLFWLRGWSDSCCLLTVLTVLFGLLRHPVTSISNIPSASSGCLPINGDESIIPLTMSIVVETVLVAFYISTFTSPITGNSFLRALCLIFVFLIFSSGACSRMCANWLSSIMFVSDPLSGSATIFIPFIWIVHVFHLPALSWLVWCVFTGAG